MAAGRPTKLTSDVHNQIVAAVRAGNYMETAAAYAGINKDTLYHWLRRGAKEKERVAKNKRTKVRKEEQPFVEFSDAVKKAKEFQEKILVTNALKGLYNPAFSIFFAKNNLGWKDRQDVTSNDGKLESLVIIKDGDQAK